MMSRLTDLYPVCTNYPIRIADTFFSRLTGLMGKRNVDYGLLFSPCRSIHTCFMKIPIDVIFLDKVYTVIDIHKAVKPWKLLVGDRNAYAVLELPAGIADELEITAGKHI